MEPLNLKYFNENGFLILKKFWPKELIQEIFHDARRIFFRQFKRKGYTSKQSLEQIDTIEFNNCLFRLFDEDLLALTNCGKQTQHLFSLHRLSLDKRIQDLLKQVGLLSPVISTRPVLYFNHPKLAQKKVFYKVDAHQDWRSMQGSLNAIVIWVPLVDINRDLGALEILPGSHLNGLRTNHIDAGFGMVTISNEESKKFVSVEVEPGDILLFSSFLVHQSGENVSDSPRWSCHFRYNDLDELTFIQRGYAHPYIYKPQDELITKDFPSDELVRKIYK